MSQRAAFCVFSGKGVANLRAYLMELLDSITDEMNATDDTEYDDDDQDKMDDNADVEMAVVDEEDELPGHTYVPTPTMSSRQPQLPSNTNSQHHEALVPSSSPAGRTAFSSSFVTVDQAIEPLATTNSNASTSSNPFGFLSAAPRRIRGFGQQLLVERNDSPPPSDAASNLSAQSSNGAFFRTYQEATRSNGARTPDLNFAELGHGRGSGYPPPSIPGPSGLSHSRSPVSSTPSHYEPVAGPSNLSLPSMGYQLDVRNNPSGYDARSNLSGPNLSSQWSFLHREAQSPSPASASADAHHRTTSTSLGSRAPAPAETTREQPEGRGRSVKRSLRSTFAFASNTFSFGRHSDGPFGFGGRSAK